MTGIRQAYAYATSGPAVMLIAGPVTIYPCMRKLSIFASGGRLRTWLAFERLEALDLLTWDMQ